MRASIPVTGCICAFALAMPQFMGISMAQETAGVNLALGKKVTAVPAPNYTDTGNNLEKLTDGIPAAGQITGSMWTQPTATGWVRSLLSCLVVDLETVQPISGFSYHTAAGVSEVTWPGAIYMLVSDDQKTWRYAGDLVKLDAKVNGPVPAYGKYHERKFTTRDVKLKARYLAFGVTSSLYTVTDELEVYSGDKTWPAQGDKAADLKNQPRDLDSWRDSLTAQTGIDRRIASDLDAIRANILKSTLVAKRKASLLQKTDAVSEAAADAPLPLKDFRAILPVSDAHRQLFRLQGELLAAEGLEPLTVWGGHRFQWLDVLATPDKKQRAELNFSLLQNQFRSQAFLLTNASTKNRKVSLKLPAAPKGAKDGWLQVDEVCWTDTNSGTPVADALKRLSLNKGVYKLEIPAGMTRKLWFTLDSSKLPAGNYEGLLAIESGPERKRVPFRCAVSAIAMKRPRLSLGMWDESNTRQSYAINPTNYGQARELMRSHFVDTAWGNRAAVPWPGPDAFDAQGSLKSGLDFGALDAWIKDWPEARHFFIFLVADENFGGEKMDNPLFAAKLGNWARALVSHLRESGHDPKKFGFLLVDEPHTDAQDLVQVAWSRAIKAAAPELQLFTDSLWEQPGQIKYPESLSNFDVLSPNVSFYYRGGEPARRYYEDMRLKGKSLWFYQCDGPNRLFDPQRYFRYQAWHVFAGGGEGQGFWAFGDAGQNSWNEYANTRVSYAPAFFDQTSVTNSIHWDSVREGIEDFEELAMLRDAIAACGKPALRAEAQRVLDTAVQNVTGIWKAQEALYNVPGVTAHYDWRRPDYDAGIADRELVKVRAMLERLR